MLIEASRNGHTDVVNLLLDWPQTVLSQNGAELTGNELSPATSQSHNTDVIAQPRVPMDGLAMTALCQWVPNARTTAAGEVSAGECLMMLTSVSLIHFPQHK